MEYSKLRDENVGIRFRLVEFSTTVDYNEFFDDELVDLVDTYNKNKENFKYLVDNFEKLNEKEFFKYYAPFYIWDNKKLGTEDLPFVASSLFSKGNGILSNLEINKMYSDGKDVFTKIRSEFTREILESDYKKYCKAQKEALSKVKETLKNRQVNNESSVL